MMYIKGHLQINALNALWSTDTRDSLGYLGLAKSGCDIIWHKPWAINNVEIYADLVSPEILVTFAYGHRAEDHTKSILKNWKCKSTAFKGEKLYSAKVTDNISWHIANISNELLI